MSSEIIPVAPADVDAIAALARLVWQETYPEIIGQAQIDFMLAQRYNAAQLLDELALSGIWWDQVKVDGALAAFAATLLTATHGEMKLDKLYVDPARQRLGLGGRLIDHVCARAVAQGCATLILAVNKQNGQAISAYRKHGFRVRDSVRVDIGNGFVMDDFIMARSLVSPAPKV
jgi:ribosomal protein S18 acetylase RimI-like enzyme